MKSKVVREPIGVWWQVNRHSVGIEAVKVVSFSGSFVTYLENSAWTGTPVWRERRQSREDFFPSFEEAKAVGIKRVEAEIQSLNAQLQSARSELGQWKSLKEPATEVVK